MKILVSRTGRYHTDNTNGDELLSSVLYRLWAVCPELQTHRHPLESEVGEQRTGVHYERYLIGKTNFWLIKRPVCCTTDTCAAQRVEQRHAINGRM